MFPKTDRFVFVCSFFHFLSFHCGIYLLLFDSIDRTCGYAKEKKNCATQFEPVSMINAANNDAAFRDQHSLQVCPTSNVLPYVLSYTLSILAAVYWSIHRPFLINYKKTLSYSCWVWGRHIFLRDDLSRELCTQSYVINRPLFASSKCKNGSKCLSVGVSLRLIFETI